jgi:hypothetical protein
MILHEITNNWQDAIRIDKDPSNFMSMFRGGGKITDSKSSFYEELKGRNDALTTEFDKGLNYIGNGWRTFCDGVVTTLNDALRQMQGKAISGDADIQMRNMQNAISIFTGGGGVIIPNAKFNRPKQ